MKKTNEDTYFKSFLEIHILRHIIKKLFEEVAVSQNTATLLYNKSNFDDDDKLEAASILTQGSQILEQKISEAQLALFQKRAQNSVRELRKRLLFDVGPILSTQSDSYNTFLKSYKMFLLHKAKQFNLPKIDQSSMQKFHVLLIAIRLERLMLAVLEARINKYDSTEQNESILALEQQIDQKMAEALTTNSVEELLNNIRQQNELTYQLQKVLEFKNLYEDWKEVKRKQQNRLKNKEYDELKEFLKEEIKLFKNTDLSFLEKLLSLRHSKRDSQTKDSRKQVIKKFLSGRPNNAITKQLGTIVQFEYKTYAEPFSSGVLTLESIQAAIKDQELVREVQDNKELKDQTSPTIERSSRSPSSSSSRSRSPSSSSSRSRSPSSSSSRSSSPSRSRGRSRRGDLTRDARGGSARVDKALRQLRMIDDSGVQTDEVMEIRRKLVRIIGKGS